MNKSTDGSFVRIMGRRCEKNDLASFVRIFSNIYAVSQLFT